MSMAKVSGKCVLYVMTRAINAEGNPALLAAQKHALAKKLPLAVVYCWPPKTAAEAANEAAEQNESLLNELREIESVLSKFQIPFMLLIGDAKERLVGLFHHVQPDAVYYDSPEEASSQPIEQGRLQNHPYTWPGVVIPINKLDEYIEGKLVC